jgi:hypothetical protein
LFNLAPQLGEGERVVRDLNANLMIITNPNDVLEGMGFADRALPLRGTVKLKNAHYAQLGLNGV